MRFLAAETGCLLAAIFIARVARVASCLIGLGANVGDRIGQAERAVARLTELAALRVIRCSRWYMSRAVGGPSDQPEYLNAVVSCEASCSATDLLAHLQRIENELGRVRTVRWGPRRIDLDLLLYDELVGSWPELILPHPRMAFRRFVLGPACEVAPDWLHPPTGQTLCQLLKRLDTWVPYIALCGGPVAARRLCVRETARRLGCTSISDADDAGRVEVPADGEPAGAPLELLSRRVELLAGVPESSCRGRPSDTVLSDFALAAMLPQRRALASDTDRAIWDATWDQLAPEIVYPKLLVAWEEARESPADPLSESGTSARDDPFAAPFPAPVLRLPGATSEQVVEELTAAVAAMQP
ncbi:MAG: 2-amino-4-hydroxy-6-hydroxymethyldihydropteridine diphosphokinase [Pirellulaceae bacterium]